MAIGVTPFVGREAERRVLDAVLADARSSRGSVVVLTGAAGIGKTRLAEETATAARRSFTVVWSSCGPASGGAPFWPWTQIVGDLLRRDDGLARRAATDWPGATALGGRSVAPPPLPDPGQARAALFAEVAALLAAAADGGPLLVVLDDLHQADPSSWLLLTHLALRVRSLALAVVGTWRTGEPRALDPVAAELLGRVAALPVAPLGADDVASLVAALRPGPVAPSVAAAVHRRAGGNPLLAREVVAQLGAQAVLDDPSAVTRAIPDSVRALVAGRLAPLPAASRHALAVAATVGSSFPIDVVGEVLGADVLSVLESLAGPLDAGILASLDAGGGAFPHEVVHDAVVASIPAATRARLHGEVGVALERLVARGRRVEPVELARHFFRAGPDGGALACAYARNAGERAMQMLAYEDAARLFEQAAAAAGDPARRAELLERLGDAREASGDRAAARAAYLDAADDARRAGRGDLLAAAALGLSGAIGFEIALLDRRQIDLLGEALDALAADRLALRATVMARLAVAVSFLEDEPHRLALTEEALALARASGDERALVQALAARCDAIAGPDHCASRAALAGEIVDVATRLRDHQLELLGRRLRLVALLEQGELAAADREIQAFASTAALLRRPLYSWYVPLWRAMRAEMEGRLDDARADVDEAERIAAQAASANAVALVGAHRWCVLSECAMAEEIALMVAEAHLERYPGLWPTVTRSLSAAEAGALDEARVLLDAAEADLPSAERDSEWLPMLAQVAEVVDAIGGHPVAGWTYDALVPYRSLFVVEGIGAVIRGPVERALGLLAAALDRPDEARGHFDAAVAAAQRLGASLLVARCLRDAGAALGDAGRLREARARYQALGIDRRVRELDTRLGAGRPPLPGPNRFRREGGVWRVSFGGQDVQLRDAKGLRDLARLLAAPGRPIAAVELAAAPASGRRPARDEGLHEQGDLGEVIDERARQAYRRRLAELDEEIDDADRAGDGERSARATAEKDALVAQLAAAFGLGGRPRRAGDPAERARQAVTARVREAIGRIEAVHPELGRHLRRSVRTGRLCVYEPETPVEWSS